MKQLTDFIIRCDLSGNILQVIAENNFPEISDLINIFFSSTLRPESLDGGLQFLKDIQSFGRADNRNLIIQINQKPFPLNCSGVLLAGFIFIAANNAIQTIQPQQFQEIVSNSEENRAYFNIQEEVNQTEMFEELSRLNNELINTKRELIRKNTELKRLHETLQNQSVKKE